MEFPQIAPLRTEKGQRLYREEDVAVLRRIRYLLHERGLTIEGARRILAEETRQGGGRESQGTLLPVAEGPDQDTAADEGLDSLDQVLRAELAPVAPVAPVTPGAPVAPEGASLPSSLARELVAELEDIRRLLGGGNA